MTLRIQHQRVAAIERSLRSQRTQPRGEMPQMAATPFQFPRGMMRRQPCLQHSQRLPPFLDRPPRRRAQVFAKIVEPLRPLPHDTARFAQRVARGQPRQMAAMFRQDLPRGAVQPRLQFSHDFTPLSPVAREQFRGGARRWRAQVGHEIGDGEIGLVPHGGDRRHFAGGQRPRDDLFIESPQVLEASSPARDDEKIDISLRVEGGDGLGNLLRGTGPLHAHAAHPDRDARRAPLEDAQHVLQHRALKRCDDADDFRKDRQFPLPLEREKALFIKLPLQFLKALLEAPLPARPDFRDLDLVLSARLIDRDRPAYQHGLPIGQRETDPARLALEHDRGQCGRRILEGEIEMARTGRAEIGDFTSDPYFANAGLEQIANSGSQVSDRDRILRRDAGCFDLQAQRRLVFFGSRAFGFHGRPIPDRA